MELDLTLEWQPGDGTKGVPMRELESSSMLTGMTTQEHRAADLQTKRILVMFAIGRFREASEQWYKGLVSRC